MIVTAQEIGGDVVFSGSGTFDLTAWSFLGTLSQDANVWPQRDFVVGTFQLIDGYDAPIAFSGPLSIGTGGDIFFPTSGSGDQFGTDFVFRTLVVPAGYTSGSALSGSSTYAGESFASIGLTPGTYVWSWGSGGSADSLTLIVPEPSAVLLLATGFAALAWRVRRG
jgi:hypothetical protein